MDPERLTGSQDGGVVAPSVTGGQLVTPRSGVARTEDGRRHRPAAGPVRSGLLESRPTQVEFFRRTLELYPEHVNPYIVWLGARRPITK